ncbi:dethiobiotin synthase [Salinadaptatus halalkaliphilus]|uniref:ATP-dependent dethiobiotin synthetase BioD n=1 Tax=Salinadaptatus halalkaliphilus TaxID=2419781 RepID=A0A4S3TRF2_9EURY|nr:dethiobiotin synthase [Salinadaptatus halalkaliphilus]THE65933.1 dethiobiotin synthase [Salinadaptatus halalkaliphilus]
MSDATGPIAVVGTGTGIGKTVVTAGLTRWLREEGIDARAIKPAQTGYPPDDDAGFVVEACADPEAATCPRYLEPALAPRVAADVAEEALDYEAIRAACEREIERTALPLLEGIGGLRVPLAEDHEVIDLVADLGATAIVVTRSGLGTLNHTALSVDALERRDVDVVGIVCNEYRADTVAERTNPTELERMTGYDVETVPPIGSGREDEAADPSPERLAIGVYDALSDAFLEELAGYPR